MSGSNGHAKGGEGLATADRPPRPQCTYVPNWYNNVPGQLIELPQWVVWRYEFREGEAKWTKPPFIAILNRRKGTERPNARSNDRKTCRPFEDAVNAFMQDKDRTDGERIDGIGFALFPDDPFVGIDLDHCISADGEIAPWAAEKIALLSPTYMEISPSGTGIRAFLIGELPRKGKQDGRKRVGYGDGTGAMEAYRMGRYLTVMGNPIVDCRTVERQQEGLLALVAEIDARPAKTARAKKGTPSADLNGNGHPEAARPEVVDDDDVLIDQWRKATDSDGAMFRSLFDEGDLSKVKHDASSGDHVLAKIMAKRLGNNPVRIERLFNRSALAKREKWRTRADYRSLTIGNAITDALTSDDSAKVAESGQGGTALDARLADLPRTDTGNAERLSIRFASHLRYCHPWKKWLIYDGRRWKVDDTGAIHRMAKRTARSMLAEAGMIVEKDNRVEHVKWMFASESRKLRSAMITLAESEKNIPILPAQLDSDAWRFNCMNGTIDLRTGKLHPHRREDMITRLCPVEYNPDALCPLWDQTLNLFFAKNTRLIAYWQRICGYSLIGIIRDHLMPIAYGKGSNGKSTILGTLMNVMGPDYAMKAMPDMLMAKQYESHPTALADLFGKRLVVAIETDAGRRLNESMVKELTGGDVIRARRMREDSWEFHPTHTLIMATNHKPVIRGTDTGIWRRLRLVPFNVTVAGQAADKAMPEKLAAELPGILAWCVRGALSWQEIGMEEPAEVTKETADYRDEQDILGAFLEETTVSLRDARVKASQLYAAYTRWANAANERVLTMMALGLAMKERGIEVQVSNGKWYLGIGLRHPPASTSEPKQEPES